jgi:three-Cys-motif partner protein
MPKKDLFNKPFDDGTIDKLEIFQDYFKEWLPVFLARPEPIWNQIQIFDLFAGEGKDVNGVFGSPLRILTILNDNEDLIKKSGVKIRVIINEFEKEVPIDFIKKVFYVMNDTPQHTYQVLTKRADRLFELHELLT